jgi:hypothetical protein
VSFFVTNLARPVERLVAFYNHRGTCEQYIKEGEGAVKWTRLSCRSFAANAVRLQLHALAYNLGNFMRTLAMPKTAEPWSLNSLREKLIKIGAKIVSHGPLHNLSDGRGRGAATDVPANPDVDRPTSGAAGTNVPGDEVRCHSRRRVRLDEHKAASFGPAGRASWRFGFQRVGCDRISLPRNPQRRKIATNNFGIREILFDIEGILSSWAAMSRLSTTICNTTNFTPRTLETLKEQPADFIIASPYLPSGAADGL